MKILLTVREFFDEGIANFEDLDIFEGVEGVNKERTNIFELAETLVDCNVNLAVLKRVKLSASALGLGKESINITRLSDMNSLSYLPILSRASPSKK